MSTNEKSVEWANKYKILILNSHFRLRKLRLSYQGTKNVAIYAFSSGKFLNMGVNACVKDLTNIMSVFDQRLCPRILFNFDRVVPIVYSHKICWSDVYLMKRWEVSASKETCLAQLEGSAHRRQGRSGSCHQ